METVIYIISGSISGNKYTRRVTKRLALRKGNSYFYSGRRLSMDRLNTIGTIMRNEVGANKEAHLLYNAITDDEGAITVLSEQIHERLKSDVAAILASITRCSVLLEEGTELLERDITEDGV